MYVLVLVLTRKLFITGLLDFNINDMSTLEVLFRND